MGTAESVPPVPGAAAAGFGEKLAPLVHVAENLTTKLIRSHLTGGRLQPGGAIRLSVDHILTQGDTDAEACLRQVATPGGTLLGGERCVAAAGALGMLALPASAAASVGAPHRMRVPKVWGVRLSGRLPCWVGATDVVLEMVRRHGTRAAEGMAMEYGGPGVLALTVGDRIAMAHLGRAMLGAAMTVFPSDSVTREFLFIIGRPWAFRPLGADSGARFDMYDELDLLTLEPLMGRADASVEAVGEGAHLAVRTGLIGTAASACYRDVALVAATLEALEGRAPLRAILEVSLDSPLVWEQLAKSGYLDCLRRRGARVRRALPARGGDPRSLEGYLTAWSVLQAVDERGGGGTKLSFICSPQTVIASAIRGAVTDPRTLGIDVPELVPAPRMPSGGYRRRSRRESVALRWVSTGPSHPQG